VDRIAVRPVASTGDASPVAPALSWRGAMCEKCDQIDARIEKLRILISPGLESFSRAMIEAAIETLHAEKHEFQCEDSSSAYNG